MVGKSCYHLSATARPMSLGYRRPTGEVVEGRSGCPQRPDICECATAGSLTFISPNLIHQRSFKLQLKES